MQPYYHPPPVPPLDKSPGVAFVLTFFFGPLGLLYVSIVGGLTLLLVAVVGGLFTFGIASSVAWIISIVWGCVEASRKHSEFQQWPARGAGAAMLAPDDTSVAPHT